MSTYKRDGKFLFDSVTGAMLGYVDANGVERVGLLGVAAQPTLRKLIAAAQAASGAGLVNHPTLYGVAAITIDSTTSYPAAFVQNGSASYGSQFWTYPAPNQARATVAGDPSIFSSDLFATGGYSGGSVLPQWIGNANYSASNSDNYPIIATNSASARAHWTGRYLWVLGQSLGSAGSNQMCVLVDGMFVGALAAATTGQNWIKIDFGSVIEGVVTIVCATLCCVAHIQDGSLAPITRGPLVGLLGDSYLPQVGAKMLCSSGAQYEATAYAGLQDLLIDGQGGTGYVTPGSGGTYISRLPYMLAQAPDLLWAAGGINDPYNAAFVTAVNTFFATARASLPNAVLVANGPWCPNEVNAAVGQTAYNQRSAILAALQAAGGPWIFIDNITGGWITSASTSKVGASRSWQTGTGCQLVFSAPLVGATSATLANTAFQNNGTFSSQLPTASDYVLVFSDGSIRYGVTLTSGSSAAVTWTGAVTASAVAGCFRASKPGNCYQLVNPDATHPTTPAGVGAVFNRNGRELREALLSMAQ